MGPSGCIRACGFFPDPEIGYPYPETYIAMFGEDYKPEPYICEEAKRAKKHKWYMSAMTVLPQ